MLFGSSQLNSAVEQIDAKICKLEAEIVNASSEAQAQVLRNLKLAWESVYNALSFSPTPGGMANSYATWAANSSPRARPAMPNVPFGPEYHPAASSSEPRSTDAGAAAAVDVNVAAGSITCGQCRKDVGDVLWVCATCKGLYRMCDACKKASSGPCSLLGHRLVAWPIKKRTLADDQYVICDQCKDAVVGLRWSCDTCKSFDSCNDCYIKHGRKDSHEHELKATYLSDTEAYPTETVTYTCSKCKSGIKSQQRTVMCCLQCTDFHLCAACFAQGNPCDSHDYCALAHPGKSIAASAPGAADADAAANAKEQQQQQQQSAGKKPEKPATSAAPWHGNVPFNSMHGMHRGKEHWKHGPQQSSVVSAVCDECKDAITGVRHKCTRCKDYDLCNGCFSKVSEIHPGHGFVHFGAPLSHGFGFGFGLGQGGKHGGGPGHKHPRPHFHPHPHPHPHHPHHPPHPCFQNPAAHTHVHADGHPEHGKEHGHEHRHKKDLGHAAAHVAMHAASKPPHGLSACRLVHPPFDGVPLPQAPSQLDAYMLPQLPSPPAPLSLAHVQPRCPPPLSRPPSCMMPRLPSSPGCCVCPHVACTSSCQSKEVHSDVACDSCNEPITGVRYKCGNCVDYDLCERCEANNNHNKDHLFVKIRRPIRAPVNKPMLPMVFPSVAAAQPKPPAPSPNRAPEPPKTSCAPASATASATATAPVSAVSPLTAPAAPPALPRATASVPSNISGDSGSSSNSRANVTETSQFSAIFVEDVTIPDGTTMEANEKFVKIWSVANMGDSEWPKGTMLVHMYGAPGMPGTRNVSHVVVGKRYEQVGIAVDLCAPSKPGRHTSMWRLMTPQGQYFGSMLWCTIEVPAAPTNEDKARDAVESKQLNAGAQMAKPEGLCIAAPSSNSSPSLRSLPTVAATIATAATAAAATNETGATSTSAPSPSTASIESLSNTFVKIGADLMSEIKRLEGSVKELQLRQEKLESLSNNGSSASLPIHNSNKATSTTSAASADRAVSPIDMAKVPSDAQLFMHAGGYPSSCLHGIPEASESAPAAAGRADAHSSSKAPESAGDHYSDVDLARSPLLDIIGSFAQKQGGHHSSQPQQQQQEETRVAPWSPSARSDASSMRDFYSSAARLEDLLMSSRTGSRINVGSQPSSTSHTNHTSRTSLAFTDGGVTSDADAADEYELINDFTDHSSMSPHSHHI
ncbi:hypothetical protein LPJ75_001690 [Coemansia sp. RSA 2598]|nr:hypothetical protein LPJ75_001690 [Coemansia sp. RSA 2598]